jgi:predicted nuclease of predicted toxin-antitoxin system
MARLYSDENYDHRVVAELVALGHDVLTAQAAGNAGKRIPDPDVLAFAIAQGRAVLTFNRRHFIRLHLQNANHAGIIICTDDRDIAALAARIDQAITTCGNLSGQLLRVIRPPRPKAPPTP